MKTVVFKGVELHIDENNTITTNEVAAGYGVTPQSIREHKRNHNDEFFENVHYIVKMNKFKKPSLHWTLEGVYMLGFFIKSKEAKAFRKFTAKLLSEIKKGNAEVVRATPTQLDMITPYEVRRELTTARLRLTLEKKKHRQTAEYYERKLKALEDLKPLINENFNITNENAKLKRENAELKRVLIYFKDRYHKIVQTADNQIEAMRSELVKMTNRFQILPNLANDGKNLNTDTESKHIYWNT